MDENANIKEVLDQALQEQLKIKLPIELFDPIVEISKALSYLIGYDEKQKCEQKFEVSIEALEKYSGFVRCAIERGEDYETFRVKTGAGDELASHIVAKFMADWINHYSGPDSINPPIIKKIVKSSVMSSLIKHCFKDSPLDEKKKKYEEEWWKQFIESLKKIKGTTFTLLAAANYMDISNTEEHGGLKEMLCAYIAVSFKGKSIGNIAEIFEGL